ncbi:MAG: zinc ABC transporter substrate-binding protein, partial [Candidatus Thermoplasmatota archaeon]|nr:zinc ABC transporter substrate-binding protein [Candidatus Thermoplasmatota archaeon]
MRKKSMHVVLMASVLVFSSIAGCLGKVDDDEDERTVIVSTYHIEQIVSAIVGDTVNVEILAPANVPVHDYEPTADDLLRLQDADIFFYHGLGLETWAKATLDSLGDDAPDHFETHAVADGSQVLLYNEMMIDTLCSDLSSLGTQDIHILHEAMYFMDELHSDNAAYNMGMPDDHDDHDHDDHGDDDHDGHDHDDHSDDDHDDHSDGDHDDHDDHGDGHDGHDHGDHDGHDHGNLEKMEAEETYVGNADCPADTTISVYELEAGEYVLEFESEEVETFKIAIAAMGGAHHHHHHGHGDGAFEWAGIFEMSDDTHTWSMQKVDGSYADQTMKLVLIPTDSTTEETMHSLESGVEALMEGDCTVVEDGETMSSISDGGSCFDLHVGSGDDSTFTMNTAGISGLAIYAQHVPIEFERNQHYLKDSTGEDIEPKAEEGADGHAHAHGDEDEDEMSGKAMLEMGDTNNDA